MFAVKVAVAETVAVGTPVVDTAVVDIGSLLVWVSYLVLLQLVAEDRSQNYRHEAAVGHTVMGWLHIVLALSTC